MPVFEVPGITCDHCKHAIEAEVGVVPGVNSVLVAVDAKTVTVEGNASDASIRDAISEAGYDDARLIA